MKSLRIFLFSVATFAVAATANAEQTTILKLKDGSAIYGNIIVQRPGVDITMAADSANFVVSDSHLYSSSSKKVKYEDLSRPYKRWALKKNALKGDANGRYLVLYEIKTKRYTYPNVVKLKSTQEGTNIYHAEQPSTYKIQWTDVKEIVRTMPSSYANRYLDDVVITTKGKSYQGTITSQVIGKQLSVKTSSGTHVIPLEEVAETQRVSHQESFKVNEVADYTNTLLLADEHTKEGIIITQHYGKKANDKYVTLLLPNGKTEKIQSTNIKEYRTEYQKTDNEVYKNGRVYVNEFLLSKAKTKSEGDKTLYVDKKVFPFPEGIVITFKAIRPNLQAGWYVVALEPLTMENGRTTYGYTPEIKENNAIQPSTTDMVEGVNTISYTYLSPGYYALVSPDNKDSFIIKIVK
ncbi:MAG: hypothetical protein ACI30R_05855 [Sodaliphilus sp.]